jgi:hypothetical protein
MLERGVSVSPSTRDFSGFETAYRLQAGHLASCCDNHLALTDFIVANQHLQLLSEHENDQASMQEDTLLSNHLG